MAIKHLQQHTMPSTSTRELDDLQPLFQSSAAKAPSWGRRVLRCLYQALLFWSVPYHTPVEPYDAFLMEYERQLCQCASLSLDSGPGIWLYLLSLHRFTSQYLAECESCG